MNETKTMQCANCDRIIMLDIIILSDKNPQDYHINTGMIMCIDDRGRPLIDENKNVLMASRGEIE